MQNTKKSREVQGTGTAQQQILIQFSVSAKELFNLVDYDSIKNNFENILLGWIGGESIETLNSNERVNNLMFFNKLLSHFEKINQIDEKNEIIPLETYDCLFELNKKEAKNCFKKTLVCFLESELANDRHIRSTIIYNSELIIRYLKKIYKIKEKHNLQIA